MNKQELIATVAESAGLNKGEAVRAVEAVVETISAALRRGSRCGWWASAPSPCPAARPPRAATRARASR